MTALTAERSTNERVGDTRRELMAASVKVLKGSLVMRNSAGYLTKGATVTGAFGVGRAEETIDNSAGIAGAASVTYKRGVFAFVNFASDLVTVAEMGKPCYIVDDQTVAKTTGGATRSVAGIVDGIEGSMVWVRLDEHLARAS